MLEKISKYGPLNTHDVFKFVALLLMLVDHIGFFLVPENEMLRAVGRASAPIWFYFVGRYKPSRFRWDIVVYAIGLTVLNFYLDGLYFFNILVTMIVVRLILDMAERSGIGHQMGIFFAIFLSFALFPVTYYLIDYGSLGLMIAFCGYFHRIGYNKIKTTIYFIIATVTYILVQNVNLKFGYPAIIISSIGPAIVMAALYFYKLKPIQTTDSALSYPIKLLSRYSLEVYTLQIAFFFLLIYFSH